MGIGSERGVFDVSEVSMKVVNVQARCLNIPIKFPFTETPRTEGMLLVHVETDEGIGGAGISRDAERFAVRELPVGLLPLMAAAQSSAVRSRSAWGTTALTAPIRW